MPILNGRCASVEKFTEMLLDDWRRGGDDRGGDYDHDAGDDDYDNNRDDDMHESRRSPPLAYMPVDMRATCIPSHSPSPQSPTASTTIPASFTPQTRPFLADPSPSQPATAAAVAAFQPRSIIKKSSSSIVNRHFQQPLMRPTDSNPTAMPRSTEFNGRPHAPQPHNKKPANAHELVYRPNANSSTSSAPTQKTYERLAEVYSSSDGKPFSLDRVHQSLLLDAAHFAGNLGTFLSEHVPYSVWIGMAVIEIIIGLVTLFVDLMLSGILLATHGIVRIFSSLPTPTPRRPRNSTGARKSRLFRDLCVYAFEALLILGMIVVVILGAVWVYGERYVHFHREFFEDNYCHQTVYWAAFYSVTLHLIIFGLFMFGIIFILIYGSMVSND